MHPSLCIQPVVCRVYGHLPSSLHPKGKPKSCCALGFAPGGEEAGAPVVCTGDREKSPLAPWLADAWPGTH